MLLSAFLFHLLASQIIEVSCDGKKNYNGYKIISATADTPKKLDLLLSLKESDESRSTSPGKTVVKLLVSPRRFKPVRLFLRNNDIDFTVVVTNLQNAIEDESKVGKQIKKDPDSSSCPLKSGMSWKSYHSFKTISDYIDCLASKYPDITEMFTIGSSYEGKDLKVLKVGNLDGKAGGRGKKKAVWIDGGIHAREWISPATITYFLKELIENSSKKRHQWLLRNFDIYIMPVMNPDGYEHSRDVERLWRKNRSKNENSECVGTDLNRNWGYKWGGLGTSTDPCSEIYKGTGPFSEPEAIAVRDFILKRKDQLFMYLTFHSYGQVIIYPWGYDEAENEKEDELDRVGKVGSKAMGDKYYVDNIVDVFGAAAGGSDDWAHGGAEIPYSYTVELPPDWDSEYGFILPPSEILGVGKEALNGTIAMIKAANRFEKMRN